MEKYIGEIIVVISGIVAFAVAWGVLKNRQESSDRRMSEVERQTHELEKFGSSFSREKLGQLAQMQGFQQERISGIERENVKMQEALYSLVTKVEIVVQWVKTQERDDGR